uniref:Uncharacterized protein n=1 Tax=Arundo donax TaxID=35708 RepID=A0A0A8ZNN0_ARUDO
MQTCVFGMDWDKVTALAKLTAFISLLTKGIMWSIEMDMNV